MESVHTLLKAVTGLIILCLSLSSPVMAQTDTQKEVLALLHEQDACWNRGDLDGFMQTYWQSDSLMFIGKSGVTYGWQNTLNNYKRSYPDPAAMGTLRFDIIHFENISPNYCSVVGKWHLTRIAGNLEGHFMLLLKKIRGKWKIIADHSS
jgi:ketosteroid isomerase-like protein